MRYKKKQLTPSPKSASESEGSQRVWGTKGVGIDFVCKEEKSDKNVHKERAARRSSRAATPTKSTESYPWGDRTRREA